MREEYPNYQSKDDFCAFAREKEMLEHDNMVEVNNRDEEYEDSDTGGQVDK